MTTADRLHVLAAWLDNLPVDLPEPTHVDYPNDPGEVRRGTPNVRWATAEAQTVLRILDAIGGQWLPCEWSRRTVQQYVTHLGTQIRVNVIYSAGDLHELLSAPEAVARVVAP